MEIQTERCMIRRFREYDIDSFMTYRNDLEWMKYQGFKGLTWQEYKEALLGNHSLQDGVQIAIVHKESNILIGDIYLKQEGSSFWIGYTICPPRARQGYAMEVLTSVIGVLKSKGADCMKAGVESENAPSIALLKRLGFRYVETDKDEQIFVLNFKSSLAD